MATIAGFESLHHREELCNAILKYHWDAHEANSKARGLYEQAVAISDKFLAANRDYLQDQQVVFLRYSHDHTSVFVTMAEHDSGLPMLKWIVCKPLGASGAIPRNRRDSSPELELGDRLAEEENPNWGAALYAAVMKCFWSNGDEQTRQSLHQQAVLISDKFWETNRDVLESQEWLLLNRGPYDLILLISLDRYSEEERWMIWSPAKIEAWYGALPKPIRSTKLPWVQQIAYNDLGH